MLQIRFFSLLPLLSRDAPKKPTCSTCYLTSQIVQPGVMQPKIRNEG